VRVEHGKQTRFVWVLFLPSRTPFDDDGGDALGEPPPLDARGVLERREARVRVRELGAGDGQKTAVRRGAVLVREEAPQTLFKHARRALVPNLLERHDVHARRARERQHVRDDAPRAALEARGAAALAGERAGKELEVPRHHAERVAVEAAREHRGFLGPTRVTGGGRGLDRRVLAVGGGSGGSRTTRHAPRSPSEPRAPRNARSTHGGRSRPREWRKRGGEALSVYFFRAPSSAAAAKRGALAAARGGEALACKRKKSGESQQRLPLVALRHAGGSRPHLQGGVASRAARPPPPLSFFKQNKPRLAA
jgi:hypothetical protein